MATHSSILTWKIPWTEESGRLQSMGSQELDMTEQLTLSLFKARNSVCVCMCVDPHMRGRCLVYHTQYYHRFGKPFEDCEQILY